MAAIQLQSKMVEIRSTLVTGMGCMTYIIWALLQTLLVPANAFIILSSQPVSSHRFHSGKLYKYMYETTNLLNEPQLNPVSTSKDVGFKVELDIEIKSIWTNPQDEGEQLLELRIDNPSLFVKTRHGSTPTAEFTAKPSLLETLKLYPTLIHMNLTKVLAMYNSKEDAITLQNIKKGITSLFQFEMKNVHKRELDASGNCHVDYKIIDQYKLFKTKSGCSQGPGVPHFNHTNKVLGANITRQTSVSYEFDPLDDVVSGAVGTDLHFLRIEARRQTGSEVISRQHLQLTGIEDFDEKEKRKLDDMRKVITQVGIQHQTFYIEDSLATKPEAKDCISCKSLNDLILNFKSALSGDNLASQSSAIAFLRILHKMRESDYETIFNILKNNKLNKILPQLVDIAAGAQTKASLSAALNILNFNEARNIALQERFLLAASLSTHPSEYLINKLYSLLKTKLKSAKLYETLLLTLAAVCHTYKQSNRNFPLIEDIGNHIVRQLETCDQEHCKLMHIRALKNLRDETFISYLLKYAAGKERKPAIYAMRALHTMPVEFITSDVKYLLERILLELDRPHDSTVKSLAANLLLLHNPSQELLSNLFNRFGDQNNKELNTLVLSQIKDLMWLKEDVRKNTSQVLKNPRINNYHILGQNGLSTAFSRMLASDQSANCSFTNILEISGGLLKRSTVDVFVDTPDSDMRLLSFETFAGGLTMFGGKDATEDDGEEANAGIEISLMNTQLRPFVFFTGKGELMGHVWSQTGAQRQNALQGSVLLQDHKEFVALQNGLTAEMVLTGVVSYDFSGQVQISLWHRNAHSLVEVAAAVVVQGQSRIDNSIAQTILEFNSGAQSQLNFVTDLDFTDDITMCLQMVQPDFDIIENVRKFERINGSKYMLRKYKRKVIPSAGKTYVMNKKNTDLCNKMFRK